MLLARTAEADADHRLALASAGGPAAAALLADAFALLDEAARAYSDAQAGTRNGDRAVAQRAVRVERVRLTMRAQSLLADAAAAEAAGASSVAKDRTEEALAVARRAFELRGADALRTEKPAAASVYARALLRTGRCREAEEVLEATIREGRPGLGLSPLLAAVKNRRLGRDDLTPASAATAAFLEGAAPCREEGVAPVAAHVAKYARAAELGRPADMRAAAIRVLFGVRELGVAPADAARALRAGGALGNPAAEAVRATFVREADPSDPVLVEMLRSSDAAVRDAAMSEAAGRGFERLGVRDVVEAVGPRATDAAARAEFAHAAGIEASRWSLDRLADLLGDPEERVRVAAIGALAPRFPKDRARFGYDATGAAAAREAAVAEIRAGSPAGTRRFSRPLALVSPPCSPG
jgi:hypothetical protein